MIPPIIKVRERLSFEQRKTLINKLESSGFKVSPWIFKFIYPSWHINVKNIKKEHPKSFFGYLPIGFIGRNYAELVNLDVKFPEDYHAKLIEIYDSV